MSLFEELKKRNVLRVASTFSIILLLLVFTACATTSGLFVDPVNPDPAQIYPVYPPALVELNFKSHGDRLNGILYQANGAGPHPTVVLLHGYPGNEKNLDLAQAMRRVGYNVLFFHYRGAWGSGGDFSFMHVIEDVASATEFLRAEQNQYRVDGSRLLFIGHSMGGFAALQAAARDDEIKCVAGLAPADVGIVAMLADSNEEFASGFASGADELSMLNGWNGEKVIAELKAHGDTFDVAALAPRLSGKSVLLIAADKDTVIAPDIFHAPMVAAYAAETDLLLTHAIIPGDHSFSWSRSELIDTVIVWAQDCKGIK